MRFWFLSHMCKFLVYIFIQIHTLYMHTVKTSESVHILCAGPNYVRAGRAVNQNKQPMSASN